MLRSADQSPDTDASVFLTPLSDAIPEIHKRRENRELMRAVEEYLGKDIPEYFRRSRPTLYLARHIASPNFETLRFIEIAKPFELPLVIGQDFNDKFVSQNSLKRALGKMPIVKCISSDHREMLENFTIINFEEAQGKPLRDIKTIFNIPLAKFHNDLLTEVYPHAVELFDESAWIDRNGRGNLLEHYKRFLSLFIAHGIMFEFYEAEVDDFFVENVLKPAVEYVTKEFGHRPLIANLVDDNISHIRNWNAYPSILYSQVKNACRGMCFDKLIVPPKMAGHLSKLEDAPSCRADVK
jgi:hypothetical protein